MKQLLQNLKTGTIELAEVPAPHLKEGHVLIETRASLISAGTERMLLEFGKAKLTDFCLDHFSVIFPEASLLPISALGLPAVIMAGQFG